MKIPKTLIERAASREETRYTLRAVLYDPSGKRFVATDGHIMAMVPAIPEKGEENKALIPLGAFDAMRADRRPSQVVIEGENVAIKRDKESHTFALENGKFPSYESLLPKGQEKYKFIVAIDVDLLVRLRDAIADPNCPSRHIVKLYISSDEEAIVVKPHVEDGSVGLLMPARV